MSILNFKTVEDARLSVASPQHRIVDSLISNADIVNWDDLIMAAPKSVARLTQLCLLSVEAPPISLDLSSNFQLLKNNQFSVAILQVSNKAYESLSTAHKNMYEISLKAELINAEISQAMKTLVLGKGTPDEKNVVSIFFAVI
jgi:hypothetical protein